MANDPSSAKGVDRTNALDVPNPVSNVTGWWKLGDVLGYAIMALAPAGAYFAPWLPSFLSDKHIALALGVFAVGVGIAVRYFLGERPTTTSAIKALKKTPILNAEERKGLIEYLAKLDRRHRWGIFVACLMGAITLAILVGQPLVHKSRTKVPAQVAIHNAKFYHPSEDEELFTKAPFLDAVRVSLVSEAQNGERYRIVLFSTVPFGHPTDKFDLVLDSEASRFELTGYAFRKRGNTYEPVQADLSKDGIIRLNAPESEEGDRLFGIMRLTMKDSGDFPSDLTREVRTTVNKP